MSSQLSAFGLADGYDLSSFAGGVHIGDGVLYDVGEALKLGDGTIRTNDERVIQALATYPAVVPVESHTALTEVEEPIEQGPQGGEQGEQTVANEAAGDQTTEAASPAAATASRAKGA
jgi:hypothetical protein